MASDFRQLGIAFGDILKGVPDADDPAGAAYNLIQRPRPPQRTAPDTRTAEQRLLDGGYTRTLAGGDFAKICEACEKAAAERRGMLLTGGVGCGKTLAIRSLFPRAKPVCLSDRVQRGWLCPDSDGSVMRDGQSVILDDLGTETPQNEYGVLIDIAGDFIMRWHTAHAERQVRGWLHVTTNLCGKELCDRYGLRVIDRLMSLVVVVPLGGGSKRKTIVMP